MLELANKIPHIMKHVKT